MTSNRGEVPHRSFRAEVAILLRVHSRILGSNACLFSGAKLRYLVRTDRVDPGREQVADKQKRVVRDRIYRFMYLHLWGAGLNSKLLKF